MDMDEILDTQKKGMVMAMHRRPDLDGSIGQLVAANDYAGMLRTKKRIELGLITEEESLVHVGSMARMDWIVELLADREGVDLDDYGWIRQIIANLPEYWRGSDPDDTRPEFEALFRTAYAMQPAVAKSLEFHPLHDGPELGYRNDLNPFTVYRGEPNHQNKWTYDPSTVGGLSWTLNPKVANKFATGATLRQRCSGKVIRATVLYSEVLAYITGRGEEELIVPPDRVLVTEFWNVTPSGNNGPDITVGSTQRPTPGQLWGLTERTRPR